MGRTYGVGDYITYLHIIIDLELLGDNVGTVELFVDHAAADGISVKANQQIEERRAVQDDKLLVTFDRA